jgi:hypothetical protein
MTVGGKSVPVVFRPTNVVGNYDTVDLAAETGLPIASIQAVAPNGNLVVAGPDDAGNGVRPVTILAPPVL